MPRAARPTTRLRFLALEAREVPATAVLTDGSLFITGTDAAENITVRQTATALTVSGVTGSFARSAVDTVRINALGGADTIKLNVSGAAVTEPTVIRAGAGDDTVYGGAGADYIDGESGDDRILGGGGKDKIAGDTGDDVIYGGAADDQVAGGAGEDELFGQAGIDRLWGGADYDEITGGTSRDHIHDDLAFWAVKIDDSSYIHHHILGVADNSGFGWFDAHLVDADLRRQARSAGRNDFIGRGEMIALLEQATDGSTVTANEFHDLQEIVNTDQLNLATQARYFGKKVMNGDPANQWYTGGDGTREALGNLSAGAADDHLQKLVDKWFKGKDRPMAKDYARDTTFGYRLAAGSLFVGGPSAGDIRQGDVGDCYFLAGLGAVARQDPARIRDMFTDNGDGTFTVRLFRDGTAEYVTVDRRLPVNDSGRLVFASTGALATDAANELWVALAEKAYAQFNESGWTGQDGTNSYNGTGGPVQDGEGSGGISGGWSDNVMRQVTAASVSGGSAGSASFADVRGAFTAGKAVTFTTVNEPPSDDVVGKHVYVMVGFSSTNQTITLRNPWGAGFDQPELLTLSFAQVRANFDRWDAANT